jgi:inorganic triphosphatase YgiF
MIMAREFEVKFRASANQLAAIMEEYQGFREISMATTYFDTPGQDLLPRRWTLRQRIENGVSVCALKTPCPEGGRCEWETECDDITAAIPALCELGAPAELAELTAGGLEALCSARFTRQAALIELEDCTVELALDRGFLKGGFRMNLLMEVEVELKSGSQESCLSFARQLSQAYGLAPEPHSKFRRALALYQGETL